MIYYDTEISNTLAMDYENNTEMMERLEEKLVNMNIFDFCDFIMDHTNNSNIMQELQKFFDVGISYSCDFLVDHKSNTELIKKLEKEYLNMSLYDFYDLILLDQKTRLFISHSHIYGGIATRSVCILTNILVAATFIVTWKFWRHSIGILLFTLACVDIIGSGVCLTYLLIKLHRFNFILPQTYFYLNNGFVRLSFLMMIPISANRYALICRPFTHRRITSQKSTLIQITTLTVFVAVTQIYEYLSMEMDQTVYNACRFIFFGIMSVILPLIISFVLTILVIREFRRMNRTLEDSGNAGTVSRKSEKNVTRAMIAVNVSFIVLILPAMSVEIFYSYSHVCKGKQSCEAVLTWFYLIGFINYYVNVFIYTFYLPKFRSTLFGFFKCQCCKKRLSESIEMSTV